MAYQLNGVAIAEPEIFEVTFEDIHAEGTGRNEAGVALVIILREGVRQFTAHWTCNTQEKTTILSQLNSGTHKTKTFTYVDPELGEVTKTFYTANKRVLDYANGVWEIYCDFTEV